MDGPAAGGSGELTAAAGGAFGSSEVHEEASEDACASRSRRRRRSSSVCARTLEKLGSLLPKGCKESLQRLGDYLGIVASGHAGERFVLRCAKRMGDLG